MCYAVSRSILFTCSLVQNFMENVVIALVSSISLPLISCSRIREAFFNRSMPILASKGCFSQAYSMKILNKPASEQDQSGHSTVLLIGM